MVATPTRRRVAQRAESTPPALWQDALRPESLSARPAIVMGPSSELDGF